MPDQRLDRRFEQERRALLDRIHMPEIAEIRVRARAVRRRRHTLAAGVAAVCVGMLGTVAAVVDRTGSPQTQVAASPSPTLQGWRGGGLTVLALTAQVLDLPGDLYDIQFADRRTGYALSRACVNGDRCELGFARTTDGGATWSSDVGPPVATVAREAVPQLVTVADSGVVFVTGDQSWFLATRSTAWLPSPGPRNNPTISVLPPDGRLWRPQAQSGRCSIGPVEAWLPDGARRRLANQPAMEVCGVAPARTGDGAWWVGGRITTVDGTVAAVGVTRDNGRTWTVTPLPDATGYAQVSTLGSEVYAAVVTPVTPEQLVEVRAMFRSVNRSPFRPYGRSLGAISGDVVPLLDGRLVAAGGGWLVAAGRDAPLTPAGGSLPWVGRLARTPGFWVSYDLFRNGWAAVSVDGEVWQKINLR